MYRRFALALVCASCCGAWWFAPARAQGSRALASMRWELGACGSGHDLRDAVEQQLGRPVFVPEARAQLLIVGRVSRQGRRLLAAFELRREGRLAGSRELLATSCSELLRALPIVIALAVDLDAEQVRLELPPSPPEAERAPSRQSAPASARAPLRPVDSDESSPTFALRVGAALDVGLLPTWVYSARVALRLETDALPPLELRGAFLFPALSLDEGRGVQLWGGLGAIATCPRLVHASSWLLEACGGLEGGVMIVRGQGFTEDRQAKSPLFDAFAGLRAGVQIAHLGLSLELSLTVPLPSTRYTVTRFDGSESAVATGQPLGGRLELAIATIP